MYIYQKGKMKTIFAPNSVMFQAEIERTLDIVCLVLPDTLKTDCKNFVAQYTPVIIKLLLQETRPRQVCIAAGICPNNGTKG